MSSVWHADAVFATEADQLTVAEAERIARALAHWSPDGGDDAGSDSSGNSLMRELAIHDPRHLNLDALWAARGSQASAKWMSFPAGLRRNGEVQHLTVRSKDTGGMGFHGIVVGTTGSGKTELFLSCVFSLCLTHSPLVANVVFVDMKFESAAQDLQGLPHVPAALSNLGEDKRHLGERMRMTLLGELKRRYSLLTSVGARDAGVYDEIRRARIAAGQDDLPPLPVLWIIVDEYLTLFRVHPKWQELVTILGEQGRGCNMFFVLGGQRLDMSPLQKCEDNIGYRIALRAESPSSSRDWIGSEAAAHLPSEEAGHALLKVGERDLVPFRCFYLSADFVVPKAERQRSTIEVAFEKPRPLTAVYQPVEGLDELLADSDDEAEVPDETVLNPQTGRPKRVLDIIRESLAESCSDVAPTIWLPPLEIPEPVDELVARLRGKPWYVDYGDRGAQPGLPLPVGMVDIPFAHEQKVHVLDVESDNVMVVGTTSMGKTTTLMTLVAAACLTYRPERITFVCVGDGAMFKLEEWPHVATVATREDVEGVSRIVATLEGVRARRVEAFKQLKIGIDEFRRRKFFGDPGQTDPEDNFGDLFMVIDNFNSFAREHDALSQRVLKLAADGPAYGIHVMTSQNDWIFGTDSRLKNLSNARVELKLSDFRNTEMDREAAERAFDLSRPLFGCTARPSSDMPGLELLVGVPEVSDPDTGVRLNAAEAARLVQRATGVDKHFTVKRLPGKIALRAILDAVPQQAGLLVPFAVGETALQPVSLNLASTPNALAVGLKECGKDTWLVALGQSLMTRFTPEQVRITVIDPNARMTGRIDGPHVDRYCYEAQDITDTLANIANLMKERLPQSGMGQEELRQRALRGFDGPRHVVIINDQDALVGAGALSEPPTAVLLPLVARAGEIGLHVFAARHPGNWDTTKMMDKFVNAMNKSRAPVLFMDNDPDNVTVLGRIKAQHLPPGRGVLVHEETLEGVLVGFPDDI